MGSSPKTKSDYRKKIADKRAQIARLQASKSAYPHTKVSANYQIGELKAEIAKLQAEMHDAPSK